MDPRAGRPVLVMKASMWLGLRTAAVVFVVQLAGRRGVSCDRSKDIDSSSGDESSSDDDPFEGDGGRGIDIHALTDEEIIRAFPSLSLDQMMPRLIQVGGVRSVALCISIL